MSVLPPSILAVEAQLIPTFAWLTQTRSRSLSTHMLVAASNPRLELPMSQTVKSLPSYIAIPYILTKLSQTLPYLSISMQLIQLPSKSEEMESGNIPLRLMKCWNPFLPSQQISQPCHSSKS